MANIQEKSIVVERISRSAFEQYGEVFSIGEAPQLPIDLFGGLNRVHGPLILKTSQTPEFILFKVGMRGDDIRYLERHESMTQTFIPLNGDPYTLVVAPPNVDLVDGFPAVEEIRAFFVPGDTITNLHEGTWHEPPFPTVDGQMFVITSQPDVTIGLQSKVDQNGELHLLDVDKRNPNYRLNLRLVIDRHSI